MRAGDGWCRACHRYRWTCSTGRPSNIPFGVDHVASSRSLRSHVAKYIHDLVNLGLTEKRLRSGRAQVCEWRLIQARSVHHALLGQMIDEQIEKLDLVRRNSSRRLNKRVPSAPSLAGRSWSKYSRVGVGGHAAFARSGLLPCTAKLPGSLISRALVTITGPAVCWNVGLKEGEVAHACATPLLFSACESSVSLVTAQARRRGRFAKPARAESGRYQSLGGRS
jgi:hypothetical protein